VLAVFPGSLNPGHTVRKELLRNDLPNSWTSFDYDEVGGRVLLGTDTGFVVLEL